MMWSGGAGGLVVDMVLEVDPRFRERSQVGQVSFSGLVLELGLVPRFEICPGFDRFHSHVCSR